MHKKYEAISNKAKLLGLDIQVEEINEYYLVCVDSTNKDNIVYSIINNLNGELLMKDEYPFTICNDKLSSLLAKIGICALDEILIIHSVDVSSTNYVYIHKHKIYIKGQYIQELTSPYSLLNSSHKLIAGNKAILGIWRNEKGKITDCRFIAIIDRETGDTQVIFGKDIVMLYFNGIYLNIITKDREYKFLQPKVVRNRLG